MKLFSLFKKIKNGDASFEEILTKLETVKFSHEVGLILNAYTNYLLKSNPSLRNFCDAYHTTKMTFYKYCDNFDKERALRLLNKIEGYIPEELQCQN